VPTGGGCCPQDDPGCCAGKTCVTLEICVKGTCYYHSPAVPPNEK
jgi:hypothetical protein